MSLDHTLSMFRAAGEETRLRVLTLLSQGELTVTELTQILTQSQPRVSRHLKVLNDAGLVERYREGAWVFYRLADRQDGGPDRALTDFFTALARADDRILARDADRLRMVRQTRAAAAADYFRDSAAEWDEMRKLHLPDSDIEAAMVEAVGPDPSDLFIDLGTGTGRMLEVFAPHYKRGLGYDLSPEMLSIARANLQRAGVAHAHVRQADLFALPMEDRAADLVCIHQVLHYLADPQGAVVEAARLLGPAGRLMIVDFAPHDLEFLRDDHAHRRLGFADDEVRGWCQAAGLHMARADALGPQKSAAQKKLTVKIWLCAKGTVRAVASSKKETVE